MLGGEDHTKPYYSTVKSSSEGELSSEDEVKPDVLEKNLHPTKYASTRSDRKSKSPTLKKRPAIRAPTPERQQKYKREDSQTEKHLAEKVTKIMVEERRIEIQRVSTTSTPDFSGSPSPNKYESPINLNVKTLLVAEERRSNTGSPIPGSKQYSRFDSPEHDNVYPDNTSDEEVERLAEQRMSPKDSDNDEEMIDKDEQIIDENVLLVQSKKFEDLTDEEKGLLSPEKLKKKEDEYQRRLVSQLPVYYPGIFGCRSINEYKLLNRISEGTFGVVYRAAEKNTDEIVALKQLKMEREKEGFPITSLREINMLMKCRRHPNVVGLREIVTDSTGEKIYMAMEFVEHDLRALMRQLEGRKKHFTVAQIKTLMQQLLSGIAYMHGEWVIHRDLKTANLLLSHKNILKIGDFGLAREYGDPLKSYTPLVVTLHYRSPELLLGCNSYSTAVDIWSIGCIFGEFFKLNAIYPGTSEGEQIKLIFEGIGTPNEKVWPGYNDLKFVNKFNWPNCPPGKLRQRFFKDFQESEAGLNLMTKLLNPCPELRVSADDALKHEWFKESPLPAPPESFPTWPAKSENLKNPPKQPEHLKPPQHQASIDPTRLKLLQEFNIKPTKSVASAGFSLKLGH